MNRQLIVRAKPIYSPKLRLWIPGRQDLGSGAALDLSGNGYSAAFDANASDALVWANAGYLTTTYSTTQARGVTVASSAALASFSDASQSLIVSFVVNGAVPATSIKCMGNADGGLGWRLTANASTGTMGFRVIAASGGNGATSAGAFFDSTDHKGLLIYDGGTGLAYLYRDGVVDSNANGYAMAVTGSTLSALGFSVGMSGVASNGTVGAKWRDVMVYAGIFGSLTAAQRALIVAWHTRTPGLPLPASILA